MAVKSKNRTGKEWSSLIIKANSGAFQGAIQEYNTEAQGIVPVCFTVDKAYIFRDDQGIFNSKEMQHQIKNAGCGFPEAHDDCYEEIFDGDDVNDKLVADLGLIAGDVKDIKERLESLATYGEEKDFQL